MNVFIPENPTIVLGVTPNGNVFCQSNNISPELKVILTKTPEDFEKKSSGLPFFSLNLPGGFALDLPEEFRKLNQ